jgi:hypothetical protein
MIKKQEQKLTDNFNCTKKSYNSNQEQLGKLLSFKEEKARYRKTYMNWDKIKRANSNAIGEKAKYLSKDAKDILAPVIQKLEKGERVFLNHKYISTITLCGRRQNQNIIKQLESVLDITYHNSITHAGKKHRYSYEFSYKKQMIHNEPVVVITTTLEEHSIKKKISQQNDPLYIEEENKDIEDIDLESNFLQNSEEAKTTKIETVKLKKQLPNERKAGVYHFNQYKEPQGLGYHYPLTKEDASRLQSLSERDFSLNAINEILLDMSKRRDNRFCSKAQFMAYFGKCLRFEMRDAVKTGNDNFRIKANLSKEEVKKPRIIEETEIRVYDLENRNTDGFQPITDALDKWMVKLV